TVVSTGGATAPSVLVAVTRSASVPPPPVFGNDARQRPLPAWYAIAWLENAPPLSETEAVADWTPSGCVTTAVTSYGSSASNEAGAVWSDVIEGASNALAAFVFTVSFPSRSFATTSTVNAPATSSDVETNVPDHVLPEPFVSDVWCFVD